MVHCMHPTSSISEPACTLKPSLLPHNPRSQINPSQSPHIIRLRQRWERETSRGGLTRFCRWFNLPTSLQSGDRVDLVISAMDVPGRAMLGEESLGPLSGGGRPARFDITDRLERRNRLAIELEATDVDHFTGNVQLEIFSRT